MAVRIRMKRMGRTHRPFYRICAMDARSPRDGKAIEYLGTYDPFVSEKDARVVLKRERVDYWLGVGAQASPKVAVLIRKYGTDGTHVDAQSAALEKLQATAKFVPPKVEITEKAPEAPAAEEAPAEGEAAEASAEAPAEEPAKEEGGE
ncbi:30S ribosomal protein S16 [Blastopirellula retiformator]|uniref:Small ribosomal subunit protein bS16 n=1 Tax=Blastopirellula retiformator TaxID=2527970 RepID=A0A5C5UYX5_9BACT|nr:30S ribosomal protein S16 [Blastopirellula retiformator]TWT30830.1 30S ribosomal protein S16 [Blastopirellula retiformator]